MKKHFLLVVVFFAFTAFVFAQNKLLTLDQIFSPDVSKRVAFGGSPARISWAADGKSFREVRGGKLLRVDPITGNSVPYYDSEKFANALRTTAGVSQEEANRIANSLGVHFNEIETGILVNNGNDLWHYGINSGVLKRLTNNKDQELEEDFSPDGKTISFVRGNDLYVIDIATGKENQLTRDGGDRIFNGYLVWVYEEELYGRGNNRGYWWSPDSKYIAFLRLDDSKVPPFVLPNDVPTDQIVEDTRYPQAGDPNPLVQLGIADINKRSILPNPARIPKVGEKIPASIARIGDAVKFVDLKKHKPEDLLIARVAWSLDSSSILFQALNREQTFLDLNVARLDGSITNAFQETTPAWVEVYGNPTFLKSDGMFVWESAKTGWKHLYLYDGNGKLVRQLTNGEWEVRNFYGVDEAGGWAYFSASKDSPIADNVYRVSLKGGEPQRLTEGDGNHSAVFNSTFTQFVHSVSNVNEPNKTTLRKADGSLERVISENKVPALAEYKLGQTEFMKVKTRDGFEMEAMMIKPPDFDPTKKYPVLQYAYAGPHSQTVRNSWGGNRYMWHQMLAQKGYIIWSCDNRTASGKGEVSTWPVYKNMGPLELRDIEDGIAYLKTLPYVDSDRLGFWGWSYGGFMTSYTLTHSKTFKMGIAGGTVSDWALYDSIYTERYMATPQNNRDGYASTSVIRAAKNLDSKLLLIHGVMDNNVHMQNTIQLVNELQKHNKQFELMLYPTQRHGVSNPAQVRHMYGMMTDFILRNL
ncbi:MAG: DPP IV N-terminal domain-containing protein [Pyrinomonadaceae bacterium]